MWLSNGLYWPGTMPLLLIVICSCPGLSIPPIWTQATMDIALLLEIDIEQKHHGDVTWLSGRLKSTGNRLLVQQLVQANNKAVKPQSSALLICWEGKQPMSGDNGRRCCPRSVSKPWPHHNQTLFWCRFYTTTFSSDETAKVAHSESGLVIEI